MKKFIFVLTFILAITTSVFASDVSVKINNEIVNFKDDKGNIVNAQIINDRTMVPMRKIFELLGASVEWDGTNRIVTGTKNDISIKLQIDNKTATKTINGVEENILLDTAPTIVNDRTMVPLRFIAESLDKQVGWDGANRTAIIIDYDYFANKLKTNAPALYNFLNASNNNIECNLSYNYYDLVNKANNTTFNTKINASIQNNKQNVTMNLSGTNELVKDIKNEGWSNSAFELNYDEKITLASNNEKLKEMFNAIGSSYTYDELGVNGNANAPFSEMFEIWAGIKDNEINVNTFSKLQNDFNLLCNLFNTTNVSNSNLKSVSSNINYSSYKLEYFDLAKLDNFIFNNEHAKVCNMINKLFFKKDILKDVVLYDNNSISINFTVENNIFKATITMLNDYNEKSEYIIELKNV